MQRLSFTSLPHSIQRPVLQVCILHIVLSNFKSVPRSKPIEKLVPREIEVDVILNPKSARSLVYPRSRSILHGISAAAKQYEWNVHVANKSNAMSMALHGDIETPQLVTSERVGPTLKDDHRRLEHLHRTGNDLKADNYSC